ncbi:gamma-glutamyltranspeptidase / glutathione hydrolase [Rhizobiales bacterium GAS191]|nr:gamma-glutamyltranspeptidase / glutathione hydrolase [Rhizobiales bacterium GAS113]SEC65699.1 gamma-glutamyltranspeptidase / glutathione hydrolase [Rhizobiales bacterium GAS191]
MYPTPRSHRPLIMGRNGAVGANHPMAAQAGLDLLRQGGNAVDAAVAASLALGVCEPMMSGLGGDGFYHVFMTGGSAEVFNGTGPAPMAATPERHRDGIPVTGPESVSVPGALAGLAAMHQAHGRLPFAQLCAPAIQLARHGFAATHGYRHFASENEARLAADARSAKTFLGHGLAGLVLQEDLARSLEEIAAEGAQTFYRGHLAERLANGMGEAGVPITKADLAACEAQIQAPLAISYRGFEIRQTPPNSTGFVMLEMLKIVERFDLKALSPAERVHVLVEAKKLAFLDRETYGADPRFEKVPLEHLLSDAHADELASRIDLKAAACRPLQEEVVAADTTYFCVVDAEGNAVSGIQSINSAFGSGVTAGDTGVLLNNRMAYWHLAPGHANRLVPGKRVRHTMNAPMVFKDGKLWGVLGTPGADNQVQVNAQMLVAMLDFGADPQTALEMPRWSSSQSGQGANWPHEGDGSLTIETDFGDELLAELEGLGHRLQRVAHLEGPCAMQAIRVMENGVRVAGSDPRRDGWACAY